MIAPVSSLASLFPSIFQSLLDSVFPPTGNFKPILLPSGEPAATPFTPATGGPMLVVCSAQPAPPLLPAPSGSLLDLLA